MDGFRISYVFLMSCIELLVRRLGQGKEDAQETAVTLCGILGGLIIAHYIDLLHRRLSIYLATYLPINVDVSAKENAQETAVTVWDSRESDVCSLHRLTSVMLSTYHSFNCFLDVATKENAQETAVTLCGILGCLMFAQYIVSSYPHLCSSMYLSTYLPTNVDVSAKENAQETAVTLCGILGGLMFAQYIAHPLAAWPVFLFLTGLHVYANYKGKKVKRSAGRK